LLTTHSHARNWKCGRALAVVERKDIQANQGSVLAPNFFGPSPKLFLGALEQELLLSAIDGAIDEEIARRLRLTAARSVKRRWMAVFEQVSRSLLELFPETVSSELEMRGRQKRLVLAYVRKHPQELRRFLRLRIEERAVAGTRFCRWRPIPESLDWILRLTVLQGLSGRIGLGVEWPICRPDGLCLSLRLFAHSRVATY
jgi:hypothetical protein